MEHVTCVDKEGVKTLDDAGFTAYSGEILGIAGIAGSGQKELLETIAGLQPMEGRNHPVLSSGRWRRDLIRHEPGGYPQTGHQAFLCS